MASPPSVKAFLLADVVIQDGLTRKWSVINIFNQIMAPAFPCAHPALAFYVRLADVHGRCAVRLEFRDAADALLSKVEGITVDAPGPVRTAEFSINAQGLPLKEPGNYQFQLFLNGEYAAAASLDVVRLVPPGKT